MLLLLAACSDYNVVPKEVDVDPGEVTDCEFTRVGSTAFYSYDCNPVFTTTDEAWVGEIGSTAFAVTEVLGHPFYQLWYVGYSDEDSYALGYAVSPDGTEWEPNPKNPGLSSADAYPFDKTVFQGNQVVWDPDTAQYVQLYGGLDLSSAAGDGGIGVALSEDGKSWERIEENPVVELRPSGRDGVESWCWPLDLNLGAVAGFDGYIAGSNVKSGACEAWGLHASDVHHWEIDEEIAFAAGERDAWDDQGIISLNEASLEDQDFLFYVGFGDWEDHTTYRSAKDAFLGWAEKKGGEWERKPEPIPINQTEEGEVSAVAAVTVGSRIHLWVTDVWDGASAVGYFLYDPEKAAAEDGGS